MAAPRFQFSDQPPMAAPSSNANDIPFEDILATPDEFAEPEPLDGANLDLIALRPGSQGTAVSALQGRLGIDQTGYFGMWTADRWTAKQRQLNNGLNRGKIADGIYNRQSDLDTGWNILGGN